MRFPGVTTGPAGNLAFGTSVDAAGSYGTGVSGNVVFGSPGGGNWVLNSDNYLGFRFYAADGLLHYGWAKINVGATNTVRTFVEFAWENTANTAITVGATSSGCTPGAGSAAAINTSGCGNPYDIQVTITSVGSSSGGTVDIQIDGSTVQAGATVAGSPYTFTGYTAGPTSHSVTLVHSDVLCNTSIGSVSYNPLCNDNVCSATALTFGTNGPFTNVGATTEVGEAAPPNGSCTGQSSWCNVISNTVWFTFVAPATGRVSMNFGTTQNWDSEIAIWSAPDCNALLSGGATLIAANDDITGSSPFHAAITPVCLTPGVTYYVQVDGYGSTTNAAFQLVLVDEGLVCDDSDLCTDDSYDCANNVCVFTPIPTDDGDPCTVDACLGGVVSHTPMDCDDSDACTVDACVAGVCQHTPITCDDSDPCTTDACVGGICVYTPLNCDDLNPNTLDECVGGICTHTPIGGCSDNDILLEMMTDANGAQTSWQIVNQGTTTVVCSGGTSPTYPNNTLVTANCCLPDGCYELKVYDSFGDGMTTGGYRLKDQNGKRIVDNWNDGAFGSLSTIDANTGFCLDLGTDQMMGSSCDQETLLSTAILVAAENNAVTGQYGITNSTSGYQFQIFNPDGGYLRNIFQNMTTGAGTGAQKSRSLFLGFTTNPVPSLTLLNIRVRGRIAGVNNAYGPVCRMKVTPPSGCPTTQLDNDPNHVGSTYSCGVTGKVVGASGNAGKIFAIPVAGANKYKFRLQSGSYIRNIVVTTNYLQLTNWSSNPLLCGTNTYNVDVAASINNGVSYCPFGAVCTVGITGGSNCTSLGELQALGADATSELNMWPNPNNGDQLYLQMTGIDARITEVSVEVNDLFGKRVIGGTVVTGGGDLNHVMELGSIASGVYTVTVTAGDVIKTQRLVIQ